MNRRPGHVDVTTEVGYCNFCQRTRNLRTEAHHLGALVRTLVTCETCHRTLSSTMGVEAEAEPEAAPAVRPDDLAEKAPATSVRPDELNKKAPAPAMKANPTKKAAAPVKKPAAAKKPAAKKPAAKKPVAAKKAPPAKPRSTATRKVTRKK